MVQRSIGMACAIACFLGALSTSAQNKPDPLAGPLPRPIEQIQADPEWRVYAAVVTHDHKTLQSLLDHGDSPNGASRLQGMPLTWACRLGDLEAIESLLKHGAEIDLYDPTDENALFAATRWSHPEIVRYLLAQGAEVNARRMSNGETALYEALRNRSFDILTLLTQSGADVNLPNRSGDSPLMIASLEDDIEIIEFLKAKGAKFNSPDEELLFAASHGYVPDVQRVLAAGAKVNQSYEGGITPLIAAAKNGQTAAVRALIAAGADINALDTYAHDTPLMYAIKSGHKSTILALLDAGADPTLANLGGCTPLHQAATYLDDPDIVHRLIARGDPVAAGDSIDVTPLIRAASAGHIQTLKILLDAHVPVNVQSKEGLTALMEAAMSGQADAITLLLRAGADLSIKDKTGKTALDWAIQQQQQAAIDILRKPPPLASS
jgi:ankyrin repeat protein